MTTTNEVRLLGAWPSPFVARARIALNIKTVDYEFLEEKFGSKSELLLKSNPIHKKIPVLIHGDKPVCESMVIVQYIDEAWSSPTHPILPSDAYDRAMARFWAAYIDDKWWPCVSGLRGAKGEEEKSALVKQIKEGLVLLEEVFHKTSKGKHFFGGDQIGYIDIALGSFLGWLEASEHLMGLNLLDEPTLPGLVNWAPKFRTHKAVKDVIPETEKFIEVAKILLAKPVAQSA